MTLAPAEVVVEVAGRALGVEPAAEICGRVAEAGEAARHLLGQRVVVPRVLPCGDCDACRRGHAACCAQRAPRKTRGPRETVPARYLVSVEPPLWPFGARDEDLWKLAALADAASAPYGALTRAGLTPGELLVVVGGAPRGAFAVALAKALGAHPILIDGDVRKRDRATALGAARVLGAEDAPEEQRVRLDEEARRLGASAHGYKVLDTTGTAAGRDRAIRLCPPGGTVALLDGGPDRGDPVPPPDWEALARAEVKLLGASACHPELIPELCALVVRGEVPLDPIVARAGAADAIALAIETP